MIPDTLEAHVVHRVRRGVRWLNTHYPGWPRRIKLTQFDFGNPCRCVVGFVCAERDVDGFDAAVRRLGRRRVRELGFDWGLEENDLERDALARAWEVAIRVARECVRGRA